jgi:hypothetical protein
MTSNLLALDPVRLSCEAVDFSEAICLDCHGPLEIHQPDTRLPDRLLGACSSCSAWYLIDAAASIMVHLPDEATLRGRLTGASAPRCACHPGRSAAGVRRPMSAR